MRPRHDKRSIRTGQQRLGPDRDCAHFVWAHACFRAGCARPDATAIVEHGSVAGGADTGSPGRSAPGAAARAAAAGRAATPVAGRAASACRGAARPASATSDGGWRVAASTAATKAEGGTTEASARAAKAQARAAAAEGHGTEASGCGASSISSSSSSCCTIWQRRGLPFLSIRRALSVVEGSPAAKAVWQCRHHDFRRNSNCHAQFRIRNSRSGCAVTRCLMCIGCWWGDSVRHRQLHPAISELGVI